MKKQILLAAIMIATCFGANAQVSVNVNLGVQPMWGPTGYDYAGYYYMPDIDAYYDVNARNYVYMDGGRWVTAGYLPPRYHDFDVYSAHKVVINEPSPWMHHNTYVTRYRGYRGMHDQVVIRDSRDRRYWSNPGHPHYNEWRGTNNGYGHERQGEWGGNRPRQENNHWNGNNGNRGYENHGNENHGYNNTRGHQDNGNHGYENHNNGGGREDHGNGHGHH